MTEQSSRLLGDIGATNARFALCAPDGDPMRTRIMPVEHYATLLEAIRSYLEMERIDPAPRAAALAVASPVTGDAVTLSHNPWSFAIATLKHDLNLERLLIVNDFAANALAIPRLKPEERAAIGDGTADPHGPIAVLGPGTGLGVSGLVPTAGGGWSVLAGEGGHATMAASDDRESEVLTLLRRRFGHVSAERVLSGQGLVNLYQALAELAGVAAEPYTPAQIADRDIGEREPLCRAALAMFCAMLGAVAGDLALTFGALGGVYVAGGIVPRLGARFAESAFRERFEGKGRFRHYLSAIPTYVITAPVPAFLGLSAALERKE